MIGFVPVICFFMGCWTLRKDACFQGIFKRRMLFVGYFEFSFENVLITFCLVNLNLYICTLKK